MQTITIPYGNGGKYKREAQVIRSYRDYFLIDDIDRTGTADIIAPNGAIIKKGCKRPYVIIAPSGLELNTGPHKLNSHLPPLGDDTFEAWVDWAWSLPDDLPNRIDRSSDGPSMTFPGRYGKFVKEWELPDDDRINISSDAPNVAMRACRYGNFVPEDDGLPF